MNSETEDLSRQVTDYIGPMINELQSANPHMDLTTRFCVVNFSIMQLTSNEQMCFYASCVELN